MPSGQHEAGKHTKAGQARAAKQPRVPKSKKKGSTAGTVYSGTKKGVIRKILGL